MPDFLYKGKAYYNPVEFAMDRLGGIWKMPILWRLKDKIYRYGELKKSIAHASDKMLTTQLRELESDGFINRKVYPVVPPKVEYSITEKGKLAIPIVHAIRNFGIQLMEIEGIDIENYKPKENPAQKKG
ncbi:MAG: helix-turn-helix transcriptional regulator [Alphaproteobacteria bacterium]|nr:helix-turn-helix transcriptional regulator [Alphaproteobacteria bacterium]MCB9302893.1 helix-turn-helix transcriptional regulator [Lewinellaceae bacterium]